MTAPENMDIEDRPVPPPPRMARQRNVERPLDAARALEFNDEDNIPPAPLRLVRQHAQILQDDDEDENAMDLEGGSLKKRKTNRRKNKNTKRRRNDKRKSRGGSKKRRRSVRKSRRYRK